MRPPAITITPIRNAANVGPVVSSVARVRAWTRAPAREPAMARASRIGMNRPASMTRPRLMSYHGVLAARPANADPLFWATDAYAYMISDRPWKPGLRMDRVPAPSTRDALPTASTTVGIVST